ncbi:unnamed protein product [Mytilus edulis]|uniref:Uncharacterized protein n=1 Tax=Mytilus edulis TaxID=6550 RepID=A0A8S3TLC8_MYTED|nr:unnamed protein product [Mytilus edulis]
MPKQKSRTKRKTATQNLVEDVHNLVEEQSHEIPPIYRPPVRRRKARQAVHETTTEQPYVPTANDIADALFRKFEVPACNFFINKIDEFKLRFMNNEVNPDIIMVTEVLPKNSRYIVNKSELALEGYDIFPENFPPNSGREYQEPVGYSDHNVLVFEYKCYIKYEVSKSEKFNYFKADFEMLRHDLNVNWEELLLDKITEEKRKSKSGISELHDKRDGKTYIASNDTDKAEILAELFTSVFTKEDDEDESFKRY